MNAISDTTNDFRAELKKVLETSTLGRTLNALKKYLLPDTPSRSNLGLLIGRLNSLRQKDIRGTLSFDEYNLEENKIRDSLLRFIEHLPEDDVARTGQEKKRMVVKYRAGTVKYFLPTRMQLNQEVECEISISVDDELLDEVPDANAALQERNINVSDTMSVLLTGRNNSPFEIESLNEEIQMVTNSGNTTWTYFVKPLSEGTHLLLLKVAMVKNDQGVFVKKEEVLKERIQVIAQPVEQKAVQKKELALSFFLPVVTLEPITPPSVVDDKSIFQKILIGAGGAGALALVVYLAIFGLLGNSPEPETVGVIPPPVEEPEEVEEPKEEEETVEIVDETPVYNPKWPPDLRIPELLPRLTLINPIGPWDVVFQGKVYERVNFFNYSSKAAKVVRKGTFAFSYDPTENEHVDTIVNGVPYRIAKEVKITNAQNSKLFTFSQADGGYSLTVPDSQRILVVHASPESHQAQYQRYRTGGNNIFLDFKKWTIPITVSYDLGNEVLVPAKNAEIAQAYHLLGDFIPIGNKDDIVRVIKNLGITDSLGRFLDGFKANYLNENLILNVSDHCSDFDTTYTIPASQLSDNAALQLLMPIRGIKKNKIQLKKGKNKSISSMIPEPALKRKTVRVYSIYDLANKKKAMVKIGSIKTNNRGWFIYKIKPDATVEGVKVKLIKDKSEDYYLFAVNPKLFERKSFELIFKSNLWNISSAIEFGDDFCGSKIRAENKVLRLKKAPIFFGEKDDRYF